MPLLPEEDNLIHYHRHEYGCSGLPPRNPDKGSSTPLAIRSHSAMRTAWVMKEFVETSGGRPVFRLGSARLGRARQTVQIRRATQLRAALGGYTVRDA